VSLKTNKKGIAEHELRKYYNGQLGVKKSPTVKEYYETWIEKQKPPLARKSAVRDYRQHFFSYLLPEFASTSMATLSVSHLSKFRSKLLGRGLSVKTCRNVLDGSFRALWRSAMEERLVEHDPFALLKWPRRPKFRPDPFTAEEHQSPRRDLNPWIFPCLQARSRVFAQLA
jgi:site-specific recombinase XerD